MEKGRHIGFSGLKDQTLVLIRRLRSIMYPEIFEECPCTATTVIESSVEAEQILKELIPWVKPDADVPAMTEKILQSLEGIRDVLETDIQAAYDGDPAARSKTEIMLAYPGFEAISIFRIAHLLHTMDLRPLGYSTNCPTTVANIEPRCKYQPQSNCITPAFSLVIGSDLTDNGQCGPVACSGGADGKGSCRKDNQT